MRRAVRSVSMTLPIVVLLVASPSGAGQEKSEPARRYVDATRGYSLEELVALGIRQEPSLQAAMLTVSAARQEIRQAELRANPAVSIEGRREPDGNGQWSATAEWPLELFRRGGRIGAATADAVMAAAAAEEQRRQLTLKIEKQYGTLLAAVRALALMDELTGAAEQTVSLLGARADAGAAPRLDRDAAAVDAGRMSAQRALAIGEADAAVLELKRITGLQASVPLLVRETLEQAVNRALTIDVAAAADVARLDAAVSARADVQEAIASVAVNGAIAEQLRQDGRFDVSLVGGYMRMESGFPQRALGAGGEIEPISGVFHNAVLGAMVTVPLFNRNQGGIAAADTRRAAAEKTVEARRLQASTEIASASAKLASARASVTIFTGALRETARRNLDVVREAYQLGRNTILEVLAEQRRLLELEMAYTAALAAAYDAQAELRAAHGGVQR